MTARPEDRTLRLAQADKAAQQDFERDDLSSPVASCPARQDEVFIVPVRYALAELASCSNKDWMPPTAVCPTAASRASH